MRQARFDAAGLVLAALLVSWVLISAAATLANPLPLVVMMMAAGAALLLARGTAVGGRPLAPAVVVALGAGLLLASLGGVSGSITSAGGPPLGYENANAGFFIQAALAGSMMAGSWSSRQGRVIGGLAALVFIVAAAVTGSRAGLFLLPLPVLGMVMPEGLGIRIWSAILTVGFAIALVATVAIAVGAPGGRGDDRGDSARASQGPSEGRTVEGSLGRRRVELWRQALDLMGEHQVLGVGAGGFGAESRTARSDSDLRWAHHEFLQMGAETGIPGFVLLAGVFLWGFGRLLLGPPDRLTGLGAASLAAVGAQASVDFVLHFPVVALAAAALVGTAQGGRHRSSEEGRLSILGRKALKCLVLPLGLLHRRRPGDLSVLLYHRVGSGRREIDLPLGPFRAQVADLAAREVVLGIDEALQNGVGGGMVVTVDDGFRDFHELVLPVLVEHRVPAVLYLATGLVVEEGGDATEGLTWGHLREAVATGLVTVGSHTHSHTGLGRATEAEAEGEMRRSKELIEDRLGVPCRHFSYPWGAASAEADRVARRLFVSTALPWGTNRVGSLDPYRLARLPVLRSDGVLLFRAKVTGMLDGEALLYRLVRRGPWRRS